MRKLASYLASVLFVLLFLTSFHSGVFARDPGQAGSTDDQDKVYITTMCAGKFSNESDLNRCTYCMSTSVRLGIRSTSNYPGSLPVSDPNSCTSRLQSYNAASNFDQIINTCTSCLARPSGSSNIFPQIESELAVVLDKTYSTSDAGGTLTLPSTSSEAEKAAQARVDAASNNSAVVSSCSTVSTDPAVVNNCLHCGAIQIAYGIGDIGANNACDSITDSTANKTYCSTVCSTTNAGSDSQAALDASSIGSRTKFQIPGVNCGAANTPYDACCLPTETQVSCALQDLKVVNYPKAKSWFNPLNWSANEIKSGATLAQDATISTLCSIFKDQLGRRIEKIDSAVFNNNNIPEIAGTVKATGYCVPDPTNPNVRPVGDGASCRCIDDSTTIDSNNFGQNLCNRIAPDNTDSCLACTNIAVISGMNCSSDNLSDDQKQTCNSCTSQSFYTDNASTFQAMANLGDQGRNFCQGVPPGEFDKCVECMIPSVFGISGVWTSFGCLQTDPGSFISKTVIPIGISLGAAAAFLTILYSAYLIQTSQGNPEKLKKARAYLNASLVGLMLIIFAALILQIVGIQILRIPGLT